MNTSDHLFRFGLAQNYRIAERNRAIIMLHDGGLTQRRIAQFFDLHPATISGIIRRGKFAATTIGTPPTLSRKVREKNSIAFGVFTSRAIQGVPVSNWHHWEKMMDFGDKI